MVGLLMAAVMVAAFTSPTPAGASSLDAMTPTASAHQIKQLPGAPSPMPANLFGGHITVDAAAGRAIYYMFTESQSNPATDPLVLWLTGGPGCSGIMAMFTENGMFNIDFASGNPVVNPWSWNKKANVIYIESPAGVGFSYSNTTSDYQTGDARTAQDTYNFLQGFLQIYPQFQNRNFWVTGESYGGHYIPEIVHLVLVYNNNLPSGAIKIPMAGLMAGNPWTDPEVEAFGVTDNWWQRAMISKATSDDINTFCSYENITSWIINNVTAAAAMLQTRGMSVKEEPLRTHVSLRDAHLLELVRRASLVGGDVKKCFDALYQASIVEFGKIDILGTYMATCVDGYKPKPEMPNACSTNQLTTYLNRADVQAVINLGPVKGITWAPCNQNTLVYNQVDTKTSVLPLYQSFIKNYPSVRLLIYSGDNDAIVPTTGTRRWLEKLFAGVTPVKNTHQWFVNTNGMQVGGWATQYPGLLFTTVRDAGHMVPTMQPQRAFYMFDTFINGGTL